MSDSNNLPTGFQYSGVACGIKESGKADLALVASIENCVAAGVYTQNLVRAASIDWNRNVTPSQSLRAVVINSGNANACTGEEGIGNNRQMAEWVASKLGCEPNQILVLSTGIIGHQLPMAKVEQGINSACQALASLESKFHSAAEAILTTDVSPKTSSKSVDSKHGKATILGMAKGAGMIGPNMATMLSIITTDAKLTTEEADKALRIAVDNSFNRISVEGHTSTNDAVILMAQSGESAIDVDFDSFVATLTELCVEMAKLIPTDGEGATHLVEINVSGAPTDQEADLIARTIANSNLVKTAVAGSDPNWGRIVSAAGYTKGVSFDPGAVSLNLNETALFKNGQPCEFDAAAVSDSIKTNFRTKIELSVGKGQGTSVHWTSDLTVDYVKFNSEYST